MLNTYRSGLLFAFATALIWAFLALKLKLALIYVDAYSLVWIRFFVAFVLLLIWALFTKKNIELKIKPLSFMITCSLGLALNYLGFLKGINLAGPVTAQIIIQIGPLLLSLMGVIVFKEKIRKKQLYGLFLLIPGFILFYAQKFSQASGQFYNEGSLWVLFGAISWAVYAVFQKLLTKNYNSVSLNLFIFGFCTLLYLPIVNFKIFFNIPWYAQGLVFLLGLNTLLAYSFVAEALRRIEANKVGVIITLNPLLTVLVVLVLESFNFTYFGPESLGLKTLIGIFLFISGAVIFIYFGRPPKDLPIEVKARKKGLD